LPLRTNARLKGAKARLEAKANAEREEQKKKLRDREVEEKRASTGKNPDLSAKDPKMPSIGTERQPLTTRLAQSEIAVYP
jgi:hypothetical protein